MSKHQAHLHARTHAPSHAKQQGAALMVAMVMIFMLTILGISAMRDATLEGQLAANSVHKEVTFQSAESATDIILAIENAASPESIESVICKDDMQFTKDDLSVPDVQETTVTLEYAGRSLPVGWSIGGPIGGRRFVISGESTLIEASTSTKITQGVIAIGAVDQGSDC